MATDLILSEAIADYLGFGSHPFPQHNHQCLISKYGPSNAAALEAQVRSIIDEAVSTPVDWSVHTLASAADVACHAIAQRHPELTSRAIEALGWKFSFDWR